ALDRGDLPAAAAQDERDKAQHLPRHAQDTNRSRTVRPHGRALNGARKVMTHLTEEDLVAFRDPEAPLPAPDRAMMRPHLDTGAACRGVLATLDRLFAALDVPVPEPGPAYEREMWAHIQDQLVSEPRRSWTLGAWLLPQVGLAAGVTLLLVGLVWF